MHPTARLFIFIAGLWAAIEMAVFLLMLTGVFYLRTAFDAITWHAHEFSFGFLGAILAVALFSYRFENLPENKEANGKAALPIGRFQTGLLIGLWLAGRIVIALSELLPNGLIIVVDLAFSLALMGCALLLLRDKKPTGLPTTKASFFLPILIAVIFVFFISHCLYHFEVASNTYAAHGFGLRLWLSTQLIAVSLIVRQRFIGLSLAVFSLWVLIPDHMATGVLLLLLSLLQLRHLLHFPQQIILLNNQNRLLSYSYGFVFLGSFLMAAGIFIPLLFDLYILDPAAAQHFWLAGSTGLLALAIMVDKTFALPFTSTRLPVIKTSTHWLYGLLIISVLMRFIGGITPMGSFFFYMVSVYLWFATFSGFILLYGPLLLRYKAKNRQVSF